MRNERYQLLLGKLLDDEISESGTRELEQMLRGDHALLQDCQEHLALWEVFSQQRLQERSAGAFAAGWRARVAAEEDKARFTEGVTRRIKLERQTERRAVAPTSNKKEGKSSRAREGDSALLTPQFRRVFRRVLARVW